ncbi:MAG: hypothetical protein HYZ50_02580 [Deltaproteobacteria bacterium]|nr:hypothetical protein [Deltaproteobacteria bacterium]
MNILDEDIGQSQGQHLAGRKIHFWKIGAGVGRAGMKDREDILPLLHRLKQPTFFTLDHGFYHPTLRHQRYCLVFLDVWDDEAAEYIRRLLRHSEFRTRAQRMGKVVRVRHSGVNYWQIEEKEERTASW